MTTLRFVDTSLRDGNQSLWGAVGLTTGMAEAVGPALDRIGLDAIDFTSSTNLLMGAKTHREDPWERISRMRAVTPNTPLSAITTGMRFMSWDRASETVMRLSLRLMARHGLRRLQIAEPMNDIESVLTVARWAKEEGFEQVVAATTFTESPVHTDESYLAAARRFAGSADIDRVYLKDPGGLLTVERTAHLVPGLRDAVGAKPFEVHGHCTTGEAPQLYVVAARLGVDALHTGIGPLSNGTAQPGLERLLDNLDAAGIAYEADREAIAEAAQIINRIAASQGLEPGKTMPYDLAPHVHQVPGGMMGTLKRQLGELGLADQLPAVIEETGRVRADLGYPIMVTPFSQFVGSQALMNVLAARSGQERYSRIPDEVLRFVLGQYGKPLGPISDEVLEKAAALPRTKELQGELDPRNLDELHADYAKRLGRTLDDEELLLRIVMAPDVLDAVRAAGPAPAWSGAGTPGTRPNGSISSITEFIDAAHALPRWTHLSVRRGDEHVSLRRAKGAAS